MELPPLAPSPSTAAARDAAKAAAREAAKDAAAHKAAQGLEASFLAEMLQYTSLNAKPESFGGGAGEEAFGSLLTEQYAKLLAARGGIGLAERIFDVIKNRESGR